MASFSKLRDAYQTWRLTGDQDEQSLFADDAAPHSPWFAHAHPGRRPCYCWHRGEIVEGADDNADGLGQSPPRRWLLVHIGCGLHFEGGWRLYDRVRLAHGELGPIAGPWDVQRSIAARMADAVIAELEGTT